MLTRMVNVFLKWQRSKQTVFWIKITFNIIIPWKWCRNGYYFSRIFHKSETWEDPKKIREVCLDCNQISQLSDISDDIFIKSFNYPDTVKIWFNCLKNLECNMRKMSVLSKETTVSQIKDDMQLSEWTDSVQFDEYEKDRKAKDKMITKLQKQVK